MAPVNPRHHMHRIATRRGDSGQTRTGRGQAISKAHPRVRAYGSLYELNAHLGWALAEVRRARPDGADARWNALEDGLLQIQHRVFYVGSDVSQARGIAREDGNAAEDPLTQEHHVKSLERLMDLLREDTPPWRPFTIPGGSVPASAFFIATTVCRRAEQNLQALAETETVPPAVQQWVNRLSDLLFVAARYVNGKLGGPEPQLAPPSDY